MKKNYKTEALGFFNGIGTVKIIIAASAF